MKMESYMGAVPPYAVLSHTWTDEELTFQEMLVQTQVTKRKKGYAKVKRCASICQQENIQHVWIDTICIDKASSAELSEAINSMWKWYGNAIVCYAYLEDIPALFESGRGRWSKRIGDLDQSRWFKRGWTLQETIAPKKMVFFSQGWDVIGTKASLIQELAYITRIDPGVLRSGNTSTASIAQRMSWAANRETTRIEDVAYCLLGIFDVNMPLLYGEGVKAFQRLQEEIIKNSSDLSIFGWQDAREFDPSRFYYRSLLARSPDEFVSCRHLSASPDFETSNPYTVTNQGLSLRLTLLAVPHNPELESLGVPKGSLFVADIGCRDRGWLETEGIFLIRLSMKGDQYARVRPQGRAPFPSSHRAKSQNFDIRPGTQIFVRQQLSIPNDHSSRALSGFLLEDIDLETECAQWTYDIDSSTLPPSFSTIGSLIKLVDRSKSTVAPLTISFYADMITSDSPGGSFLLLLGYNPLDDETPGIWWEVAPAPSGEGLNPEAMSGLGRPEMAYGKILPSSDEITMNVRLGLLDDELVVKMRIKMKYQGRDRMLKRRPGFSYRGDDRRLLGYAQRKWV
jgi:hypothetical protein